MKVKILQLVPVKHRAMIKKSNPRVLQKKSPVLVELEREGRFPYSPKTPVKKMITKPSATYQTPYSIPISSNEQNHNSPRHRYEVNPKPHKKTMK
ncbi:hypothetical protein TNIN_172621, partial [Trichonephila inaurata madagascariensis]